MLESNPKTFMQQIAHSLGPTTPRKRGVFIFVVFETPGYAGGATQVYRWEIKAPCVKLKLPTTYFRLVIFAANCRIANHRATTLYSTLSI